MAMLLCRPCDERACWCPLLRPQGYNMDYNEQYRDLSHLCVISDKGVDMHRDAE